jgi:hypothetical protein
MALPQIQRVDRDQAITDLIEALALQEAAIASLIHAEAAKIDALVAAGIPAAESTKDVESFQAAVGGVLQVATEKAQTAHEKVNLILAQPVKEG